MNDAEFSNLAELHTAGHDPVPDVVSEVADGRTPELVWRNELGGLTFRIGDSFLKWNPRSTGVDLDRERVRLDWLAGRFPAPRVSGHGTDESAQWILTDAMPGESAVGDTWRARRDEAIGAIAAGLRAIHAVAIDDFPAEWISQTWMAETPTSLGPPPPLDDPVLVHGDACAPNTLITQAGQWSGNVDFGDLGVGDRWADLAVAALSLDWNFGEGHQNELFDAYGIEADERRIEYYRALWHLAS